jgi:hypothetical protein
MTTLDKPLLLAELGLSLIPILQGEKKPALPSWAPYQKQAATPETIRQWFTGTKNTFGVVTGEVSGLVVVDCDSTEAIQWAQDNLPSTPFVVKTGKGQHWYYKHPGTKITNRARIKTGLVGLELDLRGDGGYVLAPGAKHPSGATYTVIAGKELLEDRIGFGGLPVFNPEWIKSKQPATTNAKTRTQPSADVFERCVKYVSNIPGAPEGQRNATANDVAFKIAQGFCLDEQQGFQVLSDWNLGCLPPLEESELHRVWESACSAKCVDKGFLRDATSKAQQALTSQSVQEPERIKERSGPQVRECALIRLHLIERGEVSDDKLPMLDVLAPPRTILNTAILQLRNQSGVPKIVSGPGGLGYVCQSTRSLSPITSAKSFRARIQEVMSFGQVTSKNETERIRQVHPPCSLVEELIEMQPEEIGVPEVRRVTSVPLFGRDGTLVWDEGCHLGSGIVLLKDRSLSIPRVSPTPTVQEVADARELIQEPFHDFHFVGQADKANLIALALSYFVRELTGVAPLIAIDAPTPGSGKSLLFEAAMVPALGLLGAEKKHPALQAMNEFKEEDAEKEIASTLLSAPQVIWLDNLLYKLRSGILAKTLTSEVFDHRILGSSHRVSLRNCAIWVVTGNNVTMSDEIARRTVWVRVDSQTERPEERTGFRHPDLLAWCQQNRGRMIWAILTLVQNWVTQGRPKGESVTLGSFQKWADVLGGILHCAGIPGFLENRRDQMDKMDDESAEWRTFYEVWWERHREQRVTSQELMEIVRSCNLPSSIFSKPNEQGQITAMGQQLGKKAGRIYGGFKAEKLGLIDGKQRYKLAPNIQDVCDRLLEKQILNRDEPLNLNEGLFAI